ncbi:DUF502 domain-containing protein [bacterium]|nr:DUF502 domain-containing protein [bacterium]
MKKIFTALKVLFKKYFIAGALALLPIAGTVWLLKVIILTTDNFFTSFIPKPFRPETLIGYDIPGLGVIFALFFVTLVGVITRLYFGKVLVKFGDQILGKIPLGRGIYRGLKQFVNTIFIKDEKNKRFRRSVLVEYPKKGTYVIAFVTGDCQKKIQDTQAEHLIYVFVPTTPNPTSGFLLVVPEKETIPLDMSTEEAFKLLISGGIVTSESAGD